MESIRLGSVLKGCIIATVALVLILVYKKSQDTSVRATCVFEGSIYGTIYLTQPTDQFTYIQADIFGLSKGVHGFHIHEKGDLGDGCKAAGPHYNPFDKKHGGPNDEERHVGDLGNIESKGPVEATNVKMYDKLVQLHGSYSVLGRSFVVHADADDFGTGGHQDSLVTGHAGSRLACCIITRVDAV